MSLADLAFVSGAYVPLAEARVGIDDRGFQFADSVYEVAAVVGGRPVDFDEHVARLERSLTRMRIEIGTIPQTVRAASERLVRDNRLEGGMIYLQVTRGAWQRGLLPERERSPPTIILCTRHAPIARSLADIRPLSVLPVADIRWGACDIKTTALVANALARGEAVDKGHDDAWLVARDGTVTEATAANAFIVRGGEIVTRPEGTDILAGITRRRLLWLAKSLGIPTALRPFTLAEAETADEAFLTSATAMVTPVVRIDAATIGSGKPGPVTARLVRAYLDFCRHPPEAARAGLSAS
jgi:D-alanine transaminase